MFKELHNKLVAKNVVAILLGKPSYLADTWIVTLGWSKN